MRDRLVSIVTIVSGAVSIALAAFAYWNDRALYFYPTLIAGVALLGLGFRPRFRERSSFAAVYRGILILVISLPLADRLFAWQADAAGQPTSSVHPVKPVYSFGEARGDPAAFAAWWQYYAHEWYAGAKNQVEAPDPLRILPFVFVPNTRARFFNAEVRINNLGFRGKDISPDKGDFYRVFVLGESPTFGATINSTDRPWPDLLQALVNSRLKCAREIEVINAGTEAYNLEDNLERLRRNIVPLHPDLVISYHGYNGLKLLEALPPRAALARTIPKRASPLLARVEFRLESVFSHEQANPRALAINHDVVMKSRYARLYRQLVELSRSENFKIVLTSMSMAVVPDSPSAVFEFYAQAFPMIRWETAETAAHNLMVQEIAAETDVTYIDTTPGFSGQFDSDYFLDPVHFTQKGADKFAEIVFNGLSPVLKDDAQLKCAAVAPN